MIKLEQYNNKNLRRLTLNDITIWFSYETPIAFKANTGRISDAFVSKNEWSNTTGRHLGIVKRELGNYIETSHNNLMLMMEEFN